MTISHKLFLMAIAAFIAGSIIPGSAIAGPDFILIQQTRKNQLAYDKQQAQRAQQNAKRQEKTGHQEK